MENIFRLWLTLAHQGELGWVEKGPGVGVLQMGRARLQGARAQAGPRQRAVQEPYCAILDG